MFIPILGHDPIWLAHIFQMGSKQPTRWPCPKIAVRSPSFFQTAGLVATRPCYGFARSRRAVETPRLEGDVSRILLPWDSSPLHHKFGECFSNRLLQKIKDMGSKSKNPELVYFFKRWKYRSCWHYFAGNDNCHSSLWHCMNVCCLYFSHSQLFPAIHAHEYRMWRCDITANQPTPS